jgi:hypothetical protein
MFLDEKKSGEAATKIEVPSLRGLIAWLETQDPDIRYDYTKSSECLLARYLIAIGERSYNLTANDAKTVFTGAGHVIQSHNWTYGAALARA